MRALFSSPLADEIAEIVFDAVIMAIIGGAVAFSTFPLYSGLFQSAPYELMLGLFYLAPLGFLSALVAGLVWRIAFWKKLKAMMPPDKS